MRKTLLTMSVPLMSVEFQVELLLGGQVKGHTKQRLLLAVSNAFNAEERAVFHIKKPEDVGEYASCITNRLTADGGGGVTYTDLVDALTLSEGLELLP